MITGRAHVATLAIALLVPAATLAGATNAAPSYLVKGNVIGGFRTATDGYTRAQHLFGGPYSSTQSPSVCVVRWPSGLIVTFKRQLPYAAFAKACRVVESAKITGGKWQTDAGLRVGSPASKITRAYPRAARRTISGVTVWVLVPRLEPALLARAENGTVRYLSVARL
jgi:hypothetical protein